MGRKKNVLVLILLVGVFFLAPIIDIQSAGAGSLEEAIAAAPKGTETGHIDPSAKPGFLNIPGAPDPSLIVGFFWAIWVGVDFFNRWGFWRYYGRRRTYHGIRPGGLWKGI